MPVLMCPNDNASMQTLNRNGVEFDMCPTCRGVWLDRGELEKLIEGARAALADHAPPQAQPMQGQPMQSQPDYGPQQPPHQPYYGERGEHGERGEYGEHGERGQHDQHGRPRRKRGFDLFDIFD